MPSPSDPGFSNERTALAWQRTALASLAGAAIVTRLTWTSLGLLAVVPLLVASVLAAWVFLVSGARYAHRAAVSRGRCRHSGGAPLALTIAIAILAASEAAAMIAS